MTTGASFSKMKREIKAEKEKPIPSPRPLKKTEREFASVMSSMIEAMAKQYKNQVLKGLNKSTVEKFEDAQTGNYAAVTLQLSKRVRRKLLKRFDDKRLAEFTKKIMRDVDSRNSKALYSDVENAIGISQKELTATEGLNAQRNALFIESEQWVKKLRDETLEQWTNETIRDMAEGKSITEILQKFEGLEEKRKNHAHFIARQQVVTFNSLMTKKRAQNLGVTMARWKTSQDERVRRCHAVRNNKEFDLSKGLYSSCDGKTLLPGVDYGCRCDYELIIPDDNT